MSAALSGEDEDQRKIKQLQQELNELEARVAVCVYSKTSTLHSVAADVKGSRLGQTVFSKILVNGVPTRALIDTGSPATIVSLDYVLRSRGIGTRALKSGWRPPRRDCRRQK